MKVFHLHSNRQRLTAHVDPGSALVLTMETEQRGAVVRVEPSAAITAGDVKFSLAIMVKPDTRRETIIRQPI